MYRLEQILEEAPHKTAAVLPFPISNYSSMMNNTCRVLLEKQGQTHKQHSSMGLLHIDVPVLANQARTYISSVQTRDEV